MFLVNSCSIHCQFTYHTYCHYKLDNDLSFMWCMSFMCQQNPKCTKIITSYNTLVWWKLQSAAPDCARLGAEIVVSNYFCTSNNISKGNQTKQKHSRNIVR